MKQSYLSFVFFFLILIATAVSAIGGLPDVYLVSPANNTFSNNNQSSHTYWFMDQEEATATCTMSYNTSDEATNIVVNATNDTQPPDTAQAEGIYSWRVSCDDGVTGVGVSENRTLYIDLTNPEMNLSSPASGASGQNSSPTIIYNITDEPFSAVANCSLWSNWTQSNTTAIYNMAGSTNPSSTHSAWFASEPIRPPGAFNMGGSALEIEFAPAYAGGSGGHYVEVAVLDAADAIFTFSGAPEAAVHKFRFELPKNDTLTYGSTVSWYGYGTATDSNCDPVVSGAYLYVFNVSSGMWDYLGVNPAPAPDWLNYTFTDLSSDYIDSSDENSIHFVAMTEIPDPGCAEAIMMLGQIDSDYIQLEFNYTMDWGVNQTDTSILPGSESFEGLNLSDGSYAWNVQCIDNASNSMWGNTTANWTFDVLSSESGSCINLSSETAPYYINENTTLCSDSYIFNASTGSGAIIFNTSNAILDCNGSNITGNGSGYGIFNSNASIEIRNCILHNYTNNIYSTAASLVIIENNTLYDASSSGLLIDGLSGSNNISNNTIYRNYGHGIDLASSADGNIFYNNTVFNNTFNGLSIRVNTSMNRIIYNNLSENGLSGLNLTSGCEYENITGNTFYKNSKYGANIDNSHYSIINSNNAMYNEKSGFYLYGCNNINVTNCTASHNNERGFLSDSSSAIILNSTANNNKNRGFNIHVKACQLVNVKAYNNTGAGIYVTITNNTRITNTTSYDNNGSGIYLYEAENTNLTNINLSRNTDGLNLSTSTKQGFYTNVSIYDTQLIDISIDASANNNNLFTNITLENTTLNNTVLISFQQKFGVVIKRADLPPIDTIGYVNISKWINTSNNSATSWLYLNVSYNSTDVASENESQLVMARHDGTSWTYVPTQNSVDAVNNIVTANITSFGVTAPMVSDTIVIRFVPPSVNNTSTGNAWVYVNVTTDKNCTNATLEWIGTNHSMSGNGTSWHLNMTGLSRYKYDNGNYTYKVYATNGVLNGSIDAWTLVTYNPGEVGPVTPGGGASVGFGGGSGLVNSTLVMPNTTRYMLGKDADANLSINTSYPGKHVIYYWIENTSGRTAQVVNYSIEEAIVSPIETITLGVNQSGDYSIIFREIQELSKKSLSESGEYYAFYEIKTSEGELMDGPNGVLYTYQTLSLKVLIILAMLGVILLAMLFSGGDKR